MSNNKHEITRYVLERMPDDERLNFDSALHAWWQDFRDSGGMRLTFDGYIAFQFYSKIDSYLFEVPKELVTIPSKLIVLNRKLDCPYYIKTGTKCSLTLFGSKEAMMLNLYGDVVKWVNSLS